MRFLVRRRRQPPSIIIVSLIDILVVLLIFMIATTTFKQQPAIKLVLPESRQKNEGAAENNLIITVAKEPPHFYLGKQAVTLEQLEAELTTLAARNPDTPVAVRTDTETPVGRFVSVMDAVKAAGFTKPVSVFTKPPGT
ncbi:MAG: biopolymer transporter ExbD [Verrucomicrobiales bacterium]|nr:biopolymer transporter ExbD [Verrucomicrobiales bacterium]